jgi:hypothetical protein
MEWVARSGFDNARDCMPESSRRASTEGDQTANSVRGEEKKAGAIASPQWLSDAQWANDADRAAFASGTHFPQQVPTPSSRLMSRSEVAPSLTAARMCRSDTALHTQTIMGAIVNANANDCQCPLRYVANHVPGGSIILKNHRHLAPSLKARSVNEALFLECQWHTCST